MLKLKERQNKIELEHRVVVKAIFKNNSVENGKDNEYNWRGTMDIYGDQSKVAPL